MSNGWGLLGTMMILNYMGYPRARRRRARRKINGRYYYYYY